MNDQTTQMLLLLLIGAIIILFILIFVYIIMKRKETKSENGQKAINEIQSKKEKKNKNNIDNKGTDGRQSIFNFMEFDRIEDSMIVQKNGKKFIMVIECQGINYDLMSSIEKTSVESGFVQFLNTIRHPIQIYIQARTVNLEKSINTYKSKLNKIESKLFSMRQNYIDMQESGTYSKEEMEKAYYEITKQTNLYEYGRDIIKDTERLSLNRSVLNKKYYLVISYYSSEIESENVDEKETSSIAFSELYTRAQSLIRSIAVCGVNGKILNSIELAELLYVAYNRDDSETIDIRKAIRTDYDSLYHTAPDVLEKRIKALDEEILKRANEKVVNGVERIRTKNRKKLDKKEESIEELADEIAKLILTENRQYIGDEIVDELLDEQEKKDKMKKGGNDDGKKKSAIRSTSKK